MQNAIEEVVNGNTVQVMKFFGESPDINPIHLSIEDRKILEELTLRHRLLTETGLEAEAYQALAKIKHHELHLSLGKPTNMKEYLEIEFGKQLTDEEQKVLLEKFPVLYTKGYNPNYGDMETYLRERMMRGESGNNWTRTLTLNGKEIQVPYTQKLWKLYNFEEIPTSVLVKIKNLQDNAMVRSVSIMAPKEALTDPLLVINGWGIGHRLVARWGKELQPIPGFDKEETPTVATVETPAPEATTATPATKKKIWGRIF